MNISFLIQQDKLYVKIAGDLDHHRASEIKDLIDSKIISEGINKLIFDLSGLVFMDSSGIGVIIGRYKLMQSLGGQMHIISSNKSVDKLLALSGIGDIVKVFENEEEIDKLA